MLYNDNLYKASLNYSYHFIELHSFLLCNSVLSVFIKLWINEWMKFFHWVMLGYLWAICLRSVQ